MMELVSMTSAGAIWMMLDSDVQKVSDTLTNTLHKWLYLLCFDDRIILTLFSLVTRNQSNCYDVCFDSTQAVWVMVSG